MNDYVIKVTAPVEKSAKSDTKPKVKTVVCTTEVEMFACVQNAIKEGFSYEVFKAQLELVLTSNPTV